MSIIKITNVKEYNTNINDILNLVNEDTVFISSWDKSDNILNMDANILEKSISDLKHINTYIMSKDMLKTKEQIADILCKKIPQIGIDNVTIVSNGTCASFISILQLIKNKVKSCLIVGPIYFTYFNLLKTFDFDIFNLSFDLFAPISIDFLKIEDELMLYNIDCVILIQPFFGSGINLSNSNLKELLELTERLKVYTIIDYVYGNMNWNSDDYFIEDFLIEKVINSQYCILYESISKRIFLNGLKSAIIYGNPSIIKQINCDSEVFLGGISYVQESLLNHIYNKDTVEVLNQTISNILLYAQNNYLLLKTLLLQSDFILSSTESGYFSLIGIPFKYFRSLISVNITKEIHDKYKILVIPHTRYYYETEDYFCFRVNLAMETSKLIPAISSLLDISSY